MKLFCNKSLVAWLLCLSLGLPKVSASIGLTEDDRLFVSGDALLRYESVKVDRPGAQRQELLRTVGHLVLGYKLDESITFQVGGRTGPLDNQQTATITLEPLNSDSSRGDRDLYIDLWEVEVRGSGWKATAGRSIYPFWSATGSVWDSDVNPAGLYFQKDWKGSAEGQPVQLGLGWYALPDGALRFTGQAITAQAKRSWALDSGKLTAAFQWLHIQGGSDAYYSRAVHHERDYDIVQLSLAYTLPAFAKSLTAGLDVFHNLTNYDPSDTFGEANEDEDLGFVLGLSWGSNRKAGDLRLRYGYFYKPALAVNPSLTEDTFSPISTSNFKGHDLRATYSLRDNITLEARALFSDQIVGSISADRYRIDLSYSF